MSSLKNIIIAEDEPELQRYYCAIVSRLGHHVSATASTGRQLIEDIKTHQPDLVITDLGMPEGNGLEAIRLSPNGTRFIVVSADDVTPEEDQLAEKIVARLTKPVDMADVVNALEQAGAGKVA